jgi:hypothetical protein
MLLLSEGSGTRTPVNARMLREILLRTKVKETRKSSQSPSKTRFPLGAALLLEHDLPPILGNSS